MSSLLDAPPEEVMQTTFPEQIVNGTDLANHRPGSFAQDESSGHSSHLISKNTKNIRGGSDGVPSYAELPGSAPDHMMHFHHDMWKINTTPPPPRSPDAACALTATSNGSGDFSDSHLSSPSASFTPINQNHSTAPFPSPSGVSRSALWTSRRAS